MTIQMDPNQFMNHFTHPYMLYNTKARSGYCTPPPSPYNIGNAQHTLIYSLLLWLAFPQKCILPSTLAIMLYVYFAVPYEQLGLPNAHDHSGMVDNIMKNATIYLQ